MIGREHAGAGVARELLAVDEIGDRVARAELGDLALVRAFAVGIAQRAGAAQDRRHLARGAIRFGSETDTNTALRFLARRCSASVTISIMRS